jgi:uncharacterized cupredoxin-like copper-binding protein
MTDAFRFTPSVISVQAWRTVKFVVINGKVLHRDGSRHDRGRGALELKKVPDMEHADAVACAHVALARGRDRLAIHEDRRYNSCLIPSHYEAIMVQKVVVK